MMTKLQYTLKSCRNYATSPMQNSQESLIRPQALSSRTRNRSTPRNSSPCWMLSAIVLAFLLFLTLAIVASATTRKSVDRPPVAISKDSLLTSRAVTPNIAFSIYVLPSLLDSLESVSDTTFSTSISTQKRLKTVSGTISIDYQNH